MSFLGLVDFLPGYPRVSLSRWPVLTTLTTLAPSTLKLNQYRQCQLRVLHRSTESRIFSCSRRCSI